MDGIKARIKNVEAHIGNNVSVLDALGIPSGIADGRKHTCPRCGKEKLRVSHSSGPFAGGCDGCKAAWTDVVGLVSHYNGMHQSESLKEIESRLGIGDHRGNGRANNPPPVVFVKPKAERAADGFCRHSGKLTFQPWSSKLAALFVSKKPPITIYGLQQAGAKFAQCKGDPNIVVPIYCGPELAEANYARFPATGAKFKTKGKPQSSMVAYGRHEEEEASTEFDRNGVLLTSTDRELLIKAEPVENLTLVRCEGVSDFLGAVSLTENLTQADRRFLIFSNSDGCRSFSCIDWFLPKLAALRPVECWSIGDQDLSGQIGSIEWCEHLSAITTTRNIELPFDLQDEKGKDLRDYFDGRSFADLISLANETPIFNIEAYSERKKKLEEDEAKKANANKITSIRNYKSERQKNSKGEESIVEVAIPLKDISKTILSLNNDFPKRNGNELFVLQSSEYRPLRKPVALFAWLREQIDVCWKQGSSFVTKDELFESMLNNVERFESVERYPHFPPVATCYYVHPEIQTGTGEHLETFLDFFAPSTWMDRELIRAAIVTQFWGGPPGQRPGFHIGAEQAQGSGKTALVNLISQLTGGSYDFSQNVSRDDICRALLNGEDSGRCILLDNVKSSHYSSSDLEAIVTARAITGHKLFQGSTSKANRFCLFVTFNSPQFSRDLAQRLISISLRTPERKSSWMNDVNTFIDKHRWEVIADVKRFFELPRQEVNLLNRWAAWQGDVLSRLREPRTIAELLTNRETRNDADLQDAESIQGELDRFAERLEYPSTWHIALSMDLLASVVSQAIGNRMSGRESAQRIDRYTQSGLLDRIRRNPSRKHGRTFCAWSCDTGRIEQVQYDVEERLNRAKEESIFDFERRKQNAIEREEY